MSQPSPAQLRSIYRSIIRELPPRPILKGPRSPVHTQLRASFASENAPTAAVAEQFIAYLKSQRMYATLLDRYNPGMDMSETERVRLTARRVGMDLPHLHKDGDK